MPTLRALFLIPDPHKNTVIRLLQGRPEGTTWEGRRLFFRRRGDGW